MIRLLDHRRVGGDARVLAAEETRRRESTDG